MIGQTISHYKILEKLGEGGMGVVYRAKDIQLKRTVALKFLPRGLEAHQAERARFLQEAQAAAALNHPNICTIYDIGSDALQQFIVMELVDGKTLREKIADGSMQIADCIKYAIQIGDALHEAHSHGIVHRDIKAENIMVNSKNQIKVMDFGLAKLKGSLKLTKTSSTVGTLAYMAPEQIQGGEVDARSDIFSFGVVLFEMLTGHLPFRGEHEAAMMYSIVNEEPMPLQKYVPDASSELIHTMNRALEKDPEDRYQTVHDMVIDLRRLKKETSRVSRVVPGMKPPEAIIETIYKPTAGMSGRMDLRFILLAAGVVVALVATGLYFFLLKSSQIDSIAVLPFENVGGNPNTEYLSDGITENIINNLTTLSTLRVAPRTTVFHFKGKEIDPLEIGRQLKVRAVLTGKLIQDGNSLKIQADLIDVLKESQLWGRQYSGSSTDALSLQRQISKDVADNLRIHVSLEEEKIIAKRSTDNALAFGVYLNGRYCWNKRTKEGLEEASRLFSRATQLDGSYALAYAGLADCYNLLPAYGGWRAVDAFPKAKEAALKALSIDSTLSEALTSFAFYLITFEWDWLAGEREFKRAINRDPQYSTAHHWYGLLLTNLKRFDEGIMELKTAQDLDPFSSIINRNYGDALYCSRRYDEAVVQLKHTIELDSAFAAAHQTLGYVYLQKKMYTQALGEFSNIEPGATMALTALGQRGEAQMIVQAILRRSEHEYVYPEVFARAYLGVGELEKALNFLERAYAERDPALANDLSVDPYWDPLRENARFVALIKKMGLQK